MPAIIEYLLKFSLSLSFLYLFYHLFLRKLTFYTWNRWYLLTYSLLSFFIPFINVNPIIENQEIKEVKIIDFIPAISNYTGRLTNIVPVQNETHWLTAWTILISILVGGSLIMLFRLCLQLISIRKMKRNATLLNSEEGTIYQVNQRIIPFSFGNAIYLNSNLHTEFEIREIVLHEYVHVKQNHTVDILIGELICIVNWYNPFAWLIRYSIRQNLEFIADHLLIHQGLDKKTYQYHLLKVVGTPIYRITNNFNLTSLKKRIAMMNANKSTRLQLLKFLFALPIISLLLVAFRDNYPSLGIMNIPLIKGLNPVVQEVLNKEDSVPISSKKLGGQVKMSDSNGLLNGITLHRGDYMDKDHRDFFRKNPSIWLLHWKLKVGELYIYSAHGKIEKFNLSLRIDSQTVKAKYGEFPSPAAGSYGGAVIKPNVTVDNKLKRFQGVNVDSSRNSLTQEGKPSGILDDNEAKFSSRINLSSGPGPLIMIDGKEGRLDQINPSDIESIYVSHRIEDIIQFGEKAEAGVDYITTKDFALKNRFFEYGKVDGITVLHANNSWSGNGITKFFGRVILSLKNTGEDILIIRGSERFDLDHFNEYLSNEEFGRVTIYDPQVAKEKYGQTVKGHVIVISTKQEDEEKPVQIALTIPENVLIIVDGIEISREDLSNLDPRNIDSINVWKNGLHLRQYGDKGKNGVIEIKTKSHNTNF
jgi:hypothetical protein